MDIRFDKGLQFPQSNGDDRIAEGKLRQLRRIPQSQYLSLKQVCEFYEVEPDSVRDILKKCVSEFKDENVISVSEDTQKEFVKKYGKFDPRYCEPTDEMWSLMVSDGEVMVPKFAMLMFPVRAVKRMGMLLSGTVAEVFKREILGIFFGQ